MKRFVLSLAVLASLALPVVAQSPKGLQIGDLFALGRVSDPQVSPDGKWIAYVVTSTDMAKNTRNNQIWVVAQTGGEPRRLTTTGSNSRPRWSPDGVRLAFISSREGTAQIWMLDMRAGGEGTRVTSLSTGADGTVWTPDGSALLFTSDVYPECPDDPCNSARAEAVDASKVKAKVATHLLYRHWTTWKDGMRDACLRRAGERRHRQGPHAR